MSEFKCHHCEESLQGKMYVQKNGANYCMVCLDAHYANICEEFKIPRRYVIRSTSGTTPASSVPSAFNPWLLRPLYPGTTRFCAISVPLERPSPKCKGCLKDIVEGDQNVEYKGIIWHKSCFVCTNCNEVIGTNNFFSKDEGFCVACYDALFTKYCMKCHKLIMSEGVSYQDQPRHNECSVCVSCSKELSGQHFTAMDDQYFCVDCYKNYKAKEYAGYKNPITGFGKGSNVVAHEQNS